MNFWMLFFGYISAYSMLFAIIMIIPTGIIVGRHFDKWFKKTYNPFISTNWMYPCKTIGRGMQYAILVIFRKGMKKSYDRMIFGDFDFRAHARLIDEIFSFMLIVPFFIGCFFGIINSIFLIISKLI